MPNYRGISMFDIVHLPKSLLPAWRSRTGSTGREWHLRDIDGNRSRDAIKVIADISGDIFLREILDGRDS